MRFLLSLTACATLALTQQTLSPRFSHKPQPTETIISNRRIPQREEKLFADKQENQMKEKHNGNFDHSRFGITEEKPEGMNDQAIQIAFEDNNHLRENTLEDKLIPLPVPGEMDKDKDKNKQKNKERNHTLYVAGFAIFFTFFGLLLGHCIRKCRNKQGKNSKKNERGFQDLEEEIRENENRLYNLRQEYSRKKLDEFKKNEEQKRVDNLKNKFQQPQPQYDPYYQPINYAQPVSQGYYQNYAPSTVPVGRRLNQSTNSDYAQDYPNV